jgi:hypothetical protein
VLGPKARNHRLSFPRVRLGYGVWRVIGPRDFAALHPGYVCFNPP